MSSALNWSKSPNKPRLASSYSSSKHIIQILSSEGTVDISEILLKYSENSKSVIMSSI